MSPPSLILGRRLLAFFLLLLPMGPAWSWNSAGHRLVAAIAWENLNDASRRQAQVLLRLHPDALRWQQKVALLGDDGEGEGRGLFAEASTWADDIRHDSRYENGVTSGDVFPDAGKHRDWHYENQPLVPHVGGSAEGAGQLGARIQALQDLLTQPGATATQRAYALVWLIHLVGDVHQPLHLVSRYDGAGHDDAGGNGQAVVVSGEKGERETNLHAYWDDLPGPPWLRGKALFRQAQTLMEETPGRSVRIGNLARWRSESVALARGVVYSFPVGEKDRVPRLDMAYQMRAKAVARQRLAEAGYRLAAMLNRALSR